MRINRRSWSGLPKAVKTSSGAAVRELFCPTSRTKSTRSVKSLRDKPRLMAPWGLVLLCSCFVVSAYGQYSGNEEFDSCSTPEGQLGQCISIRGCPPILALLQKRPVSPQTQDYLTRVRCGFEGIDPKVCCALDNQNTPQTSSPPNNGGKPEVSTKPSTGGGTVSSDLLPDTNVCGVTLADRIVGGSVTKLEDFPWMALVEYQKTNGRGFYCGGALINNRYVVTAAHCVKGKDLPRDWRIVSVRLGEHDINSEKDCDTTQVFNDEYCSDPPVNVPVVERIAHEQYDPFSASQHHDIALLRLAREVEFTDWIKPICLPLSFDLISNEYAGFNMTVAGWGKTESRSESNVKLKLDLQVKSNTECVSVYSSRVTFSDGQLCAGGERGKDSCRGDSGGPLMWLNTKAPGTVNYYLTGIVSFGPNPCGLEGWPGVYTRVTKYVPWIVSKLKP